MKSLPLILFLLGALAQLALPLRMAWQAESTLREGTPVKFRLELFDPHDPMRGKYVRLNYGWNNFTLPAEEAAKANKHTIVCAHVKVDAEGFGTITGISLQPPSEGLWFRIPARSYYNGDYHLRPPFDRYFVNEHEAYEAEQIFRQASRQARVVDDQGEPIAPPAHAVLRLMNGTAQLEDVVVDGRSLAVIARETLSGQSTMP